MLNKRQALFSHKIPFQKPGEKIRMHIVNKLVCDINKCCIQTSGE